MITLFIITYLLVGFIIGCLTVYFTENCEDGPLTILFSSTLWVIFVPVVLLYWGFELISIKLVSIKRNKKWK